MQPDWQSARHTQIRLNVREGANSRGSKATAKLTVKLTDGVGNVVTEKLGVKLKR